MFIMIAVIFDMDGVIFDSERIYVDGWRKVATENNIPDIESILFRVIGVNEISTERIFIDRYGNNFSYPLCRKKVSEYFHKKCSNGISLKPGVNEILSFLKRNQIPIALASSTNLKTVTSELSNVGIIHFFDSVIGGDMIANSKPEPDIFLAAANKLGVPQSSCYVLEDSYNGIKAAAAAHMHPIMIPDLLPPNEEMQRIAEVILTSLHEAVLYLNHIYC